MNAFVSSETLLKSIGPDTEYAKPDIQRVALATVNQMDSGINAVSAVLKKARFDVMKLMLYEDRRHKNGFNFSSKELDAVIERIRGFGTELLGISIFEFGANRAFSLMRAVKERAGIPVVLGGQHAMQYPDDCFAAGADAVCLGEGESGFLDLLKNWHNRHEGEKRNFIIKQEDLTHVPMLRESLIAEAQLTEYTPDFSYHDYYALRGENLKPLTPDIIVNPDHHQADRIERTFIYASDRGCPLNCSFCYNSILRAKFIEADEAQGKVAKTYLRRKSPEAMVRDLEIAKKENPWVEYLNLMNDDTAAHTAKELQTFATLYKERIGWPFYCMASPQKLCPKLNATGSESRDTGQGRQKVLALIDAGLTQLNMGIQTNEISSKNLYNRMQPESLVLETTDMLHEFARKDLSRNEPGKIDLFFDFIIHNPLETHADVLRTIDIIKKIKAPFDLVSHSLYIGKRSTMRQWYEEEKARNTEQGLPYNKVLEDLVGESDFHDTHKYFDLLKDNATFYVNTVIEFMAGRHDEKMIGRLPRYASDLFQHDVFVSLLADYPELYSIVHPGTEDANTLSIDVLTHPAVSDFFRTHESAMRAFFTEMNAKHPIHYSNEK